MCISAVDNLISVLFGYGFTVSKKTCWLISKVTGTGRYANWCRAPCLSPWWFWLLLPSRLTYKRSLEWSRNWSSYLMKYTRFWKRFQTYIMYLIVNYTFHYMFLIVLLYLFANLTATIAVLIRKLLSQVLGRPVLYISHFFSLPLRLPPSLCLQFFRILYFSFYTDFYTLFFCLHIFNLLFSNKQSRFCEKNCTELWRKFVEKIRCELRSVAISVFGWADWVKPRIISVKMVCVATMFQKFFWRMLVGSVALETGCLVMW
jgi:hypothetical protein